MSKQTILDRLNKEWQSLLQSYSDLPDNILLEPNVVGAWSIRDVLTHIATWEAEALNAFPIILKNEKPPSYAARGGIDGFNAGEQVGKRNLSLAQVKAELYATHARLMAFLANVPDTAFVSGSRLLRRIKWDTHHHYHEHTQQILEWRKAKNY
ncbi:MAG TPA: DinB family protein [Dehalococcoidales bacterium]